MDERTEIPRRLPLPVTLCLTKQNRFGESVTVLIGYVLAPGNEPGTTKRTAMRKLSFF
jgi:hypothetical protein